jgi:hypothetical protein
MKQITSAIISSIISDLSSRRGRLFLIKTAIVILVLIVVIILLCSGRSSSPIEDVTLSDLSITDANGNNWTLELVKGQPLLRISQSQKESGPPLIVKTNTRKAGMSKISIGITVEGQAGEKYIGGAKKNGIREPEPEFQILDKNNRILAAGKFEYG